MQCFARSAAMRVQRISKHADAASSLLVRPVELLSRNNFFFVSQSSQSVSQSVSQSSNQRHPPTKDQGSQRLDTIQHSVAERVGSPLRSAVSARILRRSTCPSKPSLSSQLDVDTNAVLVFVRLDGRLHVLQLMVEAVELLVHPRHFIVSFRVECLDLLAHRVVLGGITLHAVQL